MVSEVGLRIALVVFRASSDPRIPELVILLAGSSEVLCFFDGVVECNPFHPAVAHPFLVSNYIEILGGSSDSHVMSVHEER